MQQTAKTHMNPDIGMGMALAQITGGFADTSRTSCGFHRTTGRQVRLYGASLATHRRPQMFCLNLR